MKKHIWIVLALLTLGLFLRLYHIEFGLPHSFKADEPEFVEPAIKYTYEIRDIIKNNNYYKLIPISYVYGTVPSYFFTIAVMGFSKMHGILSLNLTKESIYIFVRVIHAVISLLIAVGGAYLYKKVFKGNLGYLLTLAVLVLNWKLIVHGHYANPDLVVTALLAFSFITIFHYYKRKNDTLFTLLTGILLGLAVGTKITTLLTIPLFLYVFYSKKDIKSAAGFVLVVVATFLATNPFSLVFSDDFVLRVLEMATKESGMVFDSVDSNPLKYLLSLFYISTPLVAFFSLFGIVRSVKNKKDLPIHILLIGHIVFYLVFFSIGSRRVDRWLLPILPIISIYGVYGITQINKYLKKYQRVLLLSIVLISICYFPVVLLGQFDRHTPKSEAYLWMRDNINELSTKYVITEEGLDPMNKLKFASVVQYPVYTSDGAQFFAPADPTMFDYVVLSSRPMQNFKRTEVIQKYPFYTERWVQFENAVLDKNKFRLLKSFELKKPNLVPLSNVYVYERL